MKNSLSTTYRVSESHRFGEWVCKSGTTNRSSAAGCCAPKTSCSSIDAEMFGRSAEILMPLHESTKNAPTTRSAGSPRILAILQERNTFDRNALRYISFELKMMSK